MSSIFVIAVPVPPFSKTRAGEECNQGVPVPMVWRLRLRRENAGKRRMRDGRRS